MITFLTDSSFLIIYNEWLKEKKQKIIIIIILKTPKSNTCKNVSFPSLNIMINISLMHTENGEICYCWGWLRTWSKFDNSCTCNSFLSVSVVDLI